MYSKSCQESLLIDCNPQVEQQAGRHGDTSGAWRRGEMNIAVSKDTDRQTYKQNVGKLQAIFSSDDRVSDLLWHADRGQTG